MEKYISNIEMYDQIQSKLTKLTDELFESYIHRKLRNGGNWTSSQLALWVFYSYDIRGKNNNELIRFAEQKRLEFFRNKTAL